MEVESPRVMRSFQQISGAIVDSWLEAANKLILQVAPRGRPGELVIVEADSNLVPDSGWLSDLGENMCHGAPVMAECRRTPKGLFRATRLELVR